MFSTLPKVSQPLAITIIPEEDQILHLRRTLHQNEDKSKKATKVNGKKKVTESIDVKTQPKQVMIQQDQAKSISNPLTEIILQDYLQNLSQINLQETSSSEEATNDSSLDELSTSDELSNTSEDEEII